MVQRALIFVEKTLSAFSKVQRTAIQQYFGALHLLNVFL